MSRHDSAFDVQTYVAKRNGMPGRAVAAAAILIVVWLVPAAVGFAFLLTPVRPHEPVFLRITPLASVSDDGVPRTFPVFVQERDAWTTLPQRQIGRVFLRRAPGSSEVSAISAVVPRFNLP